MVSEIMFIVIFIWLLKSCSYYGYIHVVFYIVSEAGGDAPEPVVRQGGPDHRVRPTTVSGTISRISHTSFIPIVATRIVSTIGDYSQVDMRGIRYKSVNLWFLTQVGTCLNRWYGKVLLLIVSQFRERPPSYYCHWNNLNNLWY